MKQSLELQTQEQQHLKVGNPAVYQLSQALQSISVQNSDCEAVGASLRLCLLKVGIRAANLPSPEEKAVLIDFIYRKYGRHKIDEINLAFDMAVMGELEVPVNHFENFSCMYFASVMNAYRKWAAIKHHEILDKPVLMIAEKKELSIEEWDEWEKDIRSYSFEAIPTVFCDFLYRTGRIILEGEQQANLISRAMDYYFKTLEPLTNEWIDFKHMRDLKLYDPKVYSRVLNISKKLAVQDYFKTVPL